MSGQRTFPVTLTNIEKDRLMNSCRVTEDRARADEYKFQQIQSAEKELANRLTNIDRKYEKETSGMSLEMQRIERDQNEKLRKQTQNFRQAINDQRGEILNVIEQQRRQVEAAMRNQKKSFRVS